MPFVGNVRFSQDKRGSREFQTFVPSDPGSADLRFAATVYPMPFLFEVSVGNKDPSIAMVRHLRRQTGFSDNARLGIQELPGVSMVLRKLVVNRTTIISVALIILCAVGGVTYEIHRRFESVVSNLEAVNRKVDQANQVADAAAASARSATAQAAEAAEHAKAAASARSQAEQLQQRAEAGQAQAQTAAQQAQEQAGAAREQMAQMRREREEELNHMQES
jgi:hypothetical protein